MKTPKTLTASQLITLLKQFPATTPVYISSDSEGNGYGTLDPKWSIAWSAEDKTLALMQFQDHLQDEDIAPLQMEQIHKELEAEEKERQNAKSRN